MLAGWPTATDYQQQTPAMAEAGHLRPSSQLFGTRRVYTSRVAVRPPRRPAASGVSPSDAARALVVAPFSADGGSNMSSPGGHRPQTSSLCNVDRRAGLSARRRRRVRVRGANRRLAIGRMARRSRIQSPTIGHDDRAPSRLDPRWLRRLSLSKDGGRGSLRAQEPMTRPMTDEQRDVPSSTGAHRMRNWSSGPASRPPRGWCRSSPRRRSRRRTSRHTGGEPAMNLFLERVRIREI